MQKLTKLSKRRFLEDATKKSKREIRERCYNVARVSFLVCLICVVLGYYFSHRETDGLRERVNSSVWAVILFFVAAIAFFLGFAYTIEGYVHGDKEDFTPIRPPIKAPPPAPPPQPSTGADATGSQVSGSRRARPKPKVIQLLDRTRQWPYYCNDDTKDNHASS